MVRKDNPGKGACPHLGVREQKKRATRRAIEQAAARLVMERGYDQVTVEMICDLAGVSPRTFFNYAGSKEGAVVGSGIPMPDITLVESFVSGRGGTVLEDLLATLADTFQEASGTDRELLEMRHTIMRRHPDLAGREFGRMEEAEGTMRELILARMRHDAGLDSRADVPQEMGQRAQMIISLTMGLVFFVSHRWRTGEMEANLQREFEAALALARNEVE